MKVSFHDEFRTWRKFIKAIKNVYKFIRNYGLEIRSMVVYLNLYDKTTGKPTEIYRTSDHAEMGLEVGRFEWLERGNEDMLVCVVAEDEISSQSAYVKKLEQYKKAKLLEAEETAFDACYMPIVARYKTSGKIYRKFDNVAELNKYGYNFKKIKTAIDENKPYLDKIWEKRGEDND